VKFRRLSFILVICLIYAGISLWGHQVRISHSQKSIEQETKANIEVKPVLNQDRIPAGQEPKIENNETANLIIEPMTALPDQ
jgi:CHASE3 domain sensor protein